MLRAGIDVGAENVKAVILKEESVDSFSIVPSGWDTSATILQAFTDVLRKAGIVAEDVQSIGATGLGRQSVKFASDYITEASCCARGVVWLFPGARTAVDIGAEQSQVLNCDHSGKVLKYARNDNCAAGAGAFLSEMASILELDLVELSNKSLNSKKDIRLNSTCTIFAESEVISLINEGTDKADIAHAVCDAIAARTVSLMHNIDIEEDLVFIGGVARIKAIATLLTSKLGLCVLVPEEPSLASAIGAALSAQPKQN